MEQILARSYGSYAPATRASSTRSSGSLASIEVDRSETHRAGIALRPPTPATHVLVAAYDRAVASRLESAWEKFVAEATAGRSFSGEDLAWLVQRALAAETLGYRPAESLARVLGAVAEHEEGSRPLIKIALERLFAHPIVAVRIASLEAMLDVDIEAAKELATRVVDHDHRSLREVAETVLRMTA